MCVNVKILKHIHTFFCIIASVEQLDFLWALLVRPPGRMSDGVGKEVSLPAFIYTYIHVYEIYIYISIFNL